MTTPTDDADWRIFDYLFNKQFSQSNQSLQKLLDSDGKQAWLKVLSIEETNALSAFIATVNHAVETIDTESPLNRIALQQTIMLGGVFTKLIPLAEYGLEQFNSRQKGKRNSAIKNGESTAEYHCLKIAIEEWSKNPRLRIGEVAKRCRKNINNQFDIDKNLTTYKQWIKAAHQAGILVIPNGAQRPGASLTP